jgi:pilus assembly protein CpaD
LSVCRALGACKHDEPVTASVPDDYRLRHPIAIRKPTARSSSSSARRAAAFRLAARRRDGLAQTWLREGTGAISATCRSTRRTRARRGSIGSSVLLAAVGVAAARDVVRLYPPDDARTLATIRLTIRNIGDCRSLRAMAGG